MAFALSFQSATKSLLFADIKIWLGLGAFPAKSLAPGSSHIIGSGVLNLTPKD